MFGRRFGSGWVSAPVVVALLLGLCATSCGRPTENKALRFCAIVQDSVGLYVGNPVTQMGYTIGKVETIEPRATDVRIGFTIDDKRAIPQDVKAVIRSSSILADRCVRTRRKL